MCRCCVGSPPPVASPADDQRIEVVTCPLMREEAGEESTYEEISSDMYEEQSDCPHCEMHRMMRDEAEGTRAASQGELSADEHFDLEFGINKLCGLCALRVGGGIINMWNGGYVHGLHPPSCARRRQRYVELENEIMEEVRQMDAERVVTH
ncbi:unnamed protein product [Hydatigera taeniaeformis]|uniref:Protein yippee-like n=1 Tax=Hydatigena taeniaeformis TaxID=6205 RepID=A0A0R3X7F4_HYDTA|nr:unnamed protein product [Hydatigera taeniaeformis]